MESEMMDEITRIFEEELPKALEEYWKDREKKMITSISADVLTAVRSEVRRDHSENRARFQSVDKSATEAAANAKLAVDTMGRLESLVIGLLSEVREDSGRRKGQAEAEAKQNEKQEKILGWFRWITGAGAGGALYKLWHHFTGRP